MRLTDDGQNEKCRKCSHRLEIFCFFFLGGGGEESCTTIAQWARKQR
jgi:hypothetical protein